MLREEEIVNRLNQELINILLIQVAYGSDPIAGS